MESSQYLHNRLSDIDEILDDNAWALIWTVKAVKIKIKKSKMMNGCDISATVRPMLMKLLW